MDEETILEISKCIQVPTFDICFGNYDGNKTLIKLCSDGKILIRGEEVDDNKEVYRALRELLHL